MSKNNTNNTHAQLLLTIPECLERLGGISRSSFYELVKDGSIRLAKIGRRTFVTEDELQRFVASLVQS